MATAIQSAQLTPSPSFQSLAGNTEKSPLLHDHKFKRSHSISVMPSSDSTSRLNSFFTDKEQKAFLNESIREKRKDIEDFRSQVLKRNLSTSEFRGSGESLHKAIKRVLREDSQYLESRKEELDTLKDLKKRQRKFCQIL